MLSTGFSLGKSISLSLTESVFIRAIALGPEASVGELVMAYSLSSLAQRQVNYWIHGNPENNEPNKPLYTIDTVNEATPDSNNNAESDNLVLVFNTENLLTKKPFELPDDIIDQIKEGKKDRIVCVFTKTAPKHSSIWRRTYDFLTSFLARDVAQTTGSLIGGTSASIAFATYAAAPSLIGLPVYYLSEWGAMYVGSYIGQQGGRVLLGDHIMRPVLEQGKSYLFGEDDHQNQPEGIELRSVKSFMPKYSNLNSSSSSSSNSSSSSSPNIISLKPGYTESQTDVQDGYFTPEPTPKAF